MIKISKMTDYAIVLLAELARGRPLKDLRDNANDNLPIADNGTRQFMSAGDLAALTLIPLPTVQLLLKKLTAGELLLAERGRDGGYALAKNLAAISVFDVLLLMEGAPALTTCVANVEAQDACDKIDHCHLTGRWQKINHVIHSALQEISLQDILSDDKTFNQNFQHYIST
ncbi:MAG: Rrf2 family transcriptional regulator [Hydrotalea sp.]|nr:Rrf2 family transcriptional regulator [Hydrotalea sp.]